MEVGLVSLSRKSLSQAANNVQDKHRLQVPYESSKFQIGLSTLNECHTVQ